MKWLFLLLVLISVKAISQDPSVFKPDSVQREIHAIPISGGLKVDGHLREAEWNQAQRAPRFTMIEPYQGNLPNHPTDVRVLYNRHFLYFGIFCKDSLGKKAIRATDFKRDFSFVAHDLITLTFDGFNDKRNAMVFAANPYGVQKDLLAFDDIYYDFDWDGLWRVRTTRTDSGWYAEIAIPWQTLRYRKSADSTQSWGFNIYRNRRLTNEVTALSPYPRSFTSMRMDYAGKLTGLQPPPPKPNIRIQPYLITSYNKQGDGVTRPTEATSMKAGGEVKWAINPNAILDLTFNTDFAQADADRQVNNTTRFSVFFPERRQFFLENASLFGLGISKFADESGGTMRIQPFFSRRIGLDDAGNPLPIAAGGRFVYRSDKRNFGALVMRQQPSGNYPGTNFFVGRFSENVGNRSRVGGLFTLKDQPGAYNWVGTMDAFVRLSESHSLSTMVSVSETSNTGKQGVSAYAQYFYTSNQWKLWWTQSIVTKNYDPQLGFVSRSDVIATTPGIFWWYRGKYLPFRKWLRAWEPSIFPEFYHQASTGKLIERTWTIYPIWLNLQSGGFFGYSVIPTYQYLSEPFEPLGVRIGTGDYYYARNMFYLSTDQSKKINLMCIYGLGTYFNGQLRSGDWLLQLAPVPHVSFLGRFNRNRFIQVGDNKTSATIDLYAIEGRFAVNPRIQLIAFYQQNSENNSKNYNIRFSWEYKPLSFLYLVVNHREFQNLSPSLQSQDQAIAKISYLRQF